MVGLAWDQLILGFLTGVAGPVLVQWLKFYNEKKRIKQKDTVAEAVKTSFTVSGKLENIKEDYSASRVWVTRFHNGGQFYPTGQSIQKFSIFYEVVEANVPSIKLSFQNIPVSLFAHSINKVYEDGYLAITDIDDPTQETYGFKYIAEDMQFKSYYLFAIFSMEGKFAGTLGVEFIEEKKILTEKEIRELSIAAAVLGGAMTAKDK